MAANKFAMLGLGLSRVEGTTRPYRHVSLFFPGDIVVPGAFIALLLRYDMSRNQPRKKASTLYFNVSFLAYVIALVVTILILQLFKHAQPALLYIVPLCLVFPLLTALVRRDWASMFAYEDHATPIEPAQGEKKKE